MKRTIALVILMSLISCVAFSKAVSNNEAEKKIRILGTLNGSIITQFESLHPNIKIDCIADNPFQSEDINKAEILHSSTYDAYVINSNNSIIYILEKGYAETIKSDALQKSAVMLYPEIQKNMFQNNAFVSYPVDIVLENWVVNKTLWQELNLKEYPRTYSDIYDLIEKWDKEYADEHPDLCMVERYEGTVGYLSRMLRQYILSNEQRDEPLSFDNQVLRAAIEEAYSHADDFDLSDEEIEAAYSQMPLIYSYTQGFGIASNDGQEYAMMMPPVLDQNDQARVEARVYYFLISPRTENYAELISFLEFYSENLPVEIQYALYPNLDEPVRPEGYEDNIQKIENEILELESLDNPDSLIKDKIKSLRDQKQKLQNTSWRISKESIENYREIAAAMYIPSDSLFFGFNADAGFDSLTSFLHQYAKAEIDLMRLISYIDKKSTMLFGESR